MFWFNSSANFLTEHRRDFFKSLSLHGVKPELPKSYYYYNIDQALITDYRQSTVTTEIIDPKPNIYVDY